MATYSILDIPGEEFFVFDAERLEQAVFARDLAENLKSPDKGDTQKRMELLEKTLSDAIGFRIAEGLYQEDPDQIIATVRPVIERQQRLQGYLQERFETAAKKAAEKRPANFAEKEIGVDAVFYTVMRSGLAVISDALTGEKQDWEKAARKIAGKEERLERYLSEQLTEDTLRILPYAISLQSARTELKQSLESAGYTGGINKLLPKPVDLSDLDLPEEQQKEVEAMLRNCISAESDFNKEFSGLAEKLGLSPEKAKVLKGKLQTVVRGSSFKLSRAVEGLVYGRVDEDVLSGMYTVKTRHAFYPLAEEIAYLGLDENEVDHVHIPNARYISMIYSTWVSGRAAISERLLKLLEIDDVSACGGSGRLKILDPQINPSPETIGKYIGHFLFGRGFVTKGNLGYVGSSKTRDWFLNLVELLGVLTVDPCVNKPQQRNSRSYHTPLHIKNLTEYALEKSTEEPDIELNKAALLGWMDDRYTQRQNRRGGRALIKPKYEAYIRRMAGGIGLELSKGFHGKGQNLITVYVGNPEAVGYVKS